MCSGGCIVVRERYADSDEYCNAIKEMIQHISFVFDKLNS